MPDNHIISLDGDFANYTNSFERLLQSMNPPVPFSSQPTKDGEVYTVHFQSTFQYEKFKIAIANQIPFLATLFNS